MTAPCNRRAQATLPHLQRTKISNELGEYIARDGRLARDLGREEFVKNRRVQVDFSDLQLVDHRAHCLLRKDRHRGPPVVFQDIGGQSDIIGQTWIGDHTNPQWRTSPFFGRSLL